jgi:hypothetical protein
MCTCHIVPGTSAPTRQSPLREWVRVVPASAIRAAKHVGEPRGRQGKLSRDQDTRLRRSISSNSERASAGKGVECRRRGDWRRWSREGDAPNLDGRAAWKGCGWWRLQPQRRAASWSCIGAFIGGSVSLQQLAMTSYTGGRQSCPLKAGARGVHQASVDRALLSAKTQLPTSKKNISCQKLNSVLVEVYAKLCLHSVYLVFLLYCGSTPSGLAKEDVYNSDTVSKVQLWLSIFTKIIIKN